MKIFILSVTFCSILASSAQQSVSDKLNVPSDLAATADHLRKTPLKRMEINVRAVRNFAKQFPDVENVTWSQMDKGFVARFKLNSINNTIYYSSDGEFLARFSVYGEKDLPRNVRHQVKSRYYDYNITNVTEAQIAGSTAYLVVVEDSKSWKRVRVEDGVLEVLESYSKG